MVICVRCGKENPEKALYCTSCGAPIHSSAGQRYSREREACFYPFGSIRTLWIFIGIIVILWGTSELLKTLGVMEFEFWPLVLIALGILILVNVLYRPKRT